MNDIAEQYDLLLSSFACESGFCAENIQNKTVLFLIPDF